MTLSIPWHITHGKNGHCNVIPTYYPHVPLKSPLVTPKNDPVTPTVLCCAS